jgi:hypothetical protein
MGMFIPHHPGNEGKKKKPAFPDKIHSKLALRSVNPVGK